MIEHHYSTRLSVAVVGSIDVGVETHKNSEHDGGSWVVVRTGPILSYCEHPAHVIRTATAWNNAIAKAERVLPADSGMAPTSPDRVVAQVTARDDETWDISGYTAEAAKDRVAVLLVRIGAITFRCYDQAAVLAMREVWREAAMVARLLWKPKVRR